MLGRPVVVFSGKVEATTYTIEGTVVDQRILTAGDIYVSYAGGVGYHVLSEDTRMIEAKVGPYEVESDDEDRILL